MQGATEYSGIVVLFHLFKKVLQQKNKISTFHTIYLTASSSRHSINTDVKIANKSSYDISKKSEK